MAWCPVCKNEYRAGITVCADCGADLVDNLEEDSSVILIYGEESLLSQMKDFLESNGIKGLSIQFYADKGMNGLTGPKAVQNKAFELMKIYMQEKEQQAHKEAFDQLTQEQKDQVVQAMMQQRKPVKPKLYESNAKKAEDNRSSAYSLFAVGILGLVLIVLVLTGVLKLPGLYNGSYIFFAIMGAICLLFIAAGFASLKNVKKFQKNVDSENDLRNALINWCKENLRGEDIDYYISLRGTACTEDELYFPRVELIKKKLESSFLNVEEALIDQLIDEEIYDMLFPNS